MPRSLTTPLQKAHGPGFTFAFQPIVDIKKREVASYEALIRGVSNESAAHILGQVEGDLMFGFDQMARVSAINLATQLGIGCDLNLNFLPRSLFRSPESILTTIQAANQAGLSLDRIVLEMIEGEIIDDYPRFTELINESRRIGLRVAIDDFGAGYSGLNLLAEFQPDQVKLDMRLIRGIEGHGPRQSIVRAINQICSDLGIDVIAEGVETEAEFGWLSGQGIYLYQGYLFARPVFECLPPVFYPKA